MILLALLFLVRCNAATVDESMTSLARSLVSSDLFLSHLRSSLVNTSVDPCHNFYRRICPVDMPEREGLWKKLVNQMHSIISVHNFLQPTEEGLAIERIRASVARDRLNYNDFTELTRALNKLDSESLIHLARFTNKDLMFLSAFLTVNDANKLATVQRLERLYKLLSGKITAIKEHTIYGLQIQVNAMLSTFSQSWYQDSKKGKFYARFETIMRYETIMMDLMRSLGSDHHRAVERLDSIIASVIEEYRRAFTAAPWSQKEDRFGYSRARIFTAYLKNMAFAIFYTKRFSIPHETKASLLSQFEKLEVEEFNKRSAFSHMPLLRYYLAHNFAVDKIIEENLGTLIPVKSDNDPLAYVAFAIKEQAYHPAAIVINQIFSMHAAHSASTASLIGFSGYTFAHEMYHQVQYVHSRLIEHNREHLVAALCVDRYMGAVCDRFTEVACAAAHTWSEDTADIYGFQVAYRVLQKHIGEDLDKIAAADLQMTHRELFFYSAALESCSRDGRSQWLYQAEDKHGGNLYRVNSVISHTADFKKTFGCYEDDLMSIPEKMQCPLFSQYLA